MRRVPVLRDRVRPLAVLIAFVGSDTSIRERLFSPRLAYAASASSQVTCVGWSGRSRLGADKGRSSSSGRFVVCLIVSIIAHGRKRLTVRRLLPTACPRGSAATSADIRNKAALVPLPTRSGRAEPPGLLLCPTAPWATTSRTRRGRADRKLLDHEPTAHSAGSAVLMNQG